MITMELPSENNAHPLSLYLYLFVAISLMRLVLVLTVRANRNLDVSLYPCLLPLCVDLDFHACTCTILAVSSSVPLAFGSPVSGDAVTSILYR